MALYIFTRVARKEYQRDEIGEKFVALAVDILAALATFLLDHSASSRVSLKRSIKSSAGSVRWLGVSRSFFGARRMG